MKTRNGFVSNSSSSSFVIVTTKDKWNEAVKEFTKKVNKNIAKIVVSEYGQGEEAKVLGQNALVFTGIFSSEDYGTAVLDDLETSGKISDDDAEDLACEAYDKMGDFEDILKNDGVSYVGGEYC